MSQITLARFEKSARCYTFNDAYAACVRASDRCHGIGAHMDGLIRQIQLYPDEPRGWSFASWARGTNISSNFKEAYAIVLEYPLDAFERLRGKVTLLGWTCIWITTETKTRNTITLAIPLNKPVNHKQYARLASVIAFKLDEYDMERGCIAAHHIVNVYATSIAVVEEGSRGVLDPVLFIKMTERDYQNQTARKFEGSAPGKASMPVPVATVMVADDLFAWPESDAERIKRELAEIEAKLGIVR